MKSIRKTAVVTAAAMLFSMLPILPAGATTEYETELLLDEKEALYSEDFEGYNLNDKWTLDTNGQYFIAEDPKDENETDKNKVAHVTSNGTVNIDLGTEVTSTVDVSFRGYVPTDGKNREWGLSVKSGDKNIAIARAGLLNKGTTITGESVGESDWSNRFGMLASGANFVSGDNARVAAENIYTFNGWEVRGKWNYVTLRVNFEEQKVYAYINADAPITAEMIETGAVKSLVVPFMEASDNIDSISVTASYMWGGNNVYFDDIKVVPSVTIQRYNVTFRDWDGSEFVESVLDQKTVNAPNNPIRPGYIFEGWYLNGQLYDFDTLVTQDIVLEAKYTKRTIVMDNTFEEYEIDTDINGQDGWTVGGGNAAVVDDADATGENKVLKMSNGYYISKEIAPTGGVFDLSYSFKWEDGNNARGQGMHFKYGNKYIVRVGVFRDGGTGWRNDFGFYKNDKDDFSSGNTNGSLYNAVSQGVGEKHKYYVKIRFNFNAQTATAIIANNEITDDAMADPAKAKEAGEILGYYENMPFLNSAEYLDAIDFNTAISNNVTYYDDFYIADVPETNPEPTEDPGTTPEVTKEPETTPEITEEPETTPEITLAPTPEITPDPTPETTPDPTSEPTAMPENVVYFEDFEGYEVGSTWELGTNTNIETDPVDVESGNKVGHIESSGSGKVVFDREITGTAEISARIRGGDRSNFAVKVVGDNGDIAVLRLGCLTTGTTLSGSKVYENYQRIYSLLTPESGDMPTDTTAMNSSTVYGLSTCNYNKWEYVKFVINPTTKTCDVYMAPTEITIDMIAEKSGLTSYCENVPFYSDSNVVTGMAIVGNWIYQRNDNIYFDNLVAASQLPPAYEILTPEYTQHDGLLEVSAKIRKGVGDAKVFTAVYNDNGELVGMDAGVNITDDSEFTAGKYTYNVSMADTDCDSVKIMVWDENMKPATTSLAAEYKEYVAPTEEPQDDLWDVEIPEYVPADVERADVPQIVTPEEVQEIPEELSDTVYRTYPEGKMKAFLISIDDGPNLGDCQLVIPLLNKNGLTAAFNVNPGEDPSQKGFLFNCTDGNGDWVNDFTSDAFKTKVLPLYENFEIGNHGTNHHPTSRLTKDGVRKEIGTGKYNCETLFGREVGGYINSWIEIPEPENPASGEWTAAYTKYTGHRYVRNAPIKNNDYTSTPEGLYYNVPDNFMNWSPTVQDGVEMKNGDNIYHINDIMDYYIQADMGNEWSVYFIWGHSTDMSSINYSNYTYTTNDTFNYFTDTCETYAANKDILWNTTPLNYVDYVNASRLTQVTTDGDTITIYNPSTCINVWMNVNGNAVEIPAGQTLTF